MQGYFVKIACLRLKRLILAAKYASYCYFKPHYGVLRLLRLLSIAGHCCWAPAGQMANP